MSTYQRASKRVGYDAHTVHPIRVRPCIGGHLPAAVDANAALDKKEASFDWNRRLEIPDRDVEEGDINWY